MKSTVRTADGAIAYRDYLQTPEWRARRNAALHRAHFRCNRCGRAARKGVPLEVHHLTYERLGDERPGDLEVLCVDCHQGETETAADDGLKLALKMARTALAVDPWVSIADLSEATKELCADHGVKLGPHVLQKAIGLVTGRRFNAPDVVERTHQGEIDEAKGPSPSEARQILERLGVNCAKQMPKARVVPPGERDRNRALGMIMQAIAEQAERCQELETAPVSEADPA